MDFLPVVKLNLIQENEQQEQFQYQSNTIYKNIKDGVFYLFKEKLPVKGASETILRLKNTQTKQNEYFTLTFFKCNFQEIKSDDILK